MWRNAFQQIMKKARLEIGDLDHKLQKPPIQVPRYNVSFGCTDPLFCQHCPGHQCSKHEVNQRSSKQEARREKYNR